jgi:hypothetical protein
MEDNLVAVLPAAVILPVAVILPAAAIPEAVGREDVREATLAVVVTPAEAAILAGEVRAKRISRGSTRCSLRKTP